MRRWSLRFGKRATDLRAGLVAKVVGTVHPEEAPRVAPFLSRDCVAYAVKGSRVEGAGRSARLIVFADLEWCPSFWLDCEPGRVLVEPEGSLRLLKSECDGRSGFERRQA